MIQESISRGCQDQSRAVFRQLILAVLPVPAQPHPRHHRKAPASDAVEGTEGAPPSAPAASCLGCASAQDGRSRAAPYSRAMQCSRVARELKQLIQALLTLTESSSLCLCLCLGLGPVLFQSPLAGNLDHRFLISRGSGPSSDSELCQWPTGLAALHPSISPGAQGSAGQEESTVDGGHSWIAGQIPEHETQN